MKMKRDSAESRVLKREIKLQINERLYQTGVISKAVYETAKSRIVSDAGGKKEDWTG